MLCSKSTNPCATKHIYFDLSPPKSFFRALFQGTPLGETLKKMLLSNAVPEELKHIECEHGSAWAGSDLGCSWDQEKV